MHSYDHLERLRRGVTVLRYHTRRTLRPQSVGEHSINVALLAREILSMADPADHLGRALTAAVMAAALEHDLAEFDTGDVPQPAKMRSPILDAEIRSMETETERRLGLVAGLALTGPEKFLLSCADTLEFLWYSLDERRLGNTDFNRIFWTGWFQLLEKLDRRSGEMPATWVAAVQTILGKLAVDFEKLSGTNGRTFNVGN